MSDQPEFDDEAQTRDVYAHFGLAIYLAQCLEHGIVNALLYAKLMPKELKRYKRHRPLPFDRTGFESRFDLFMEQNFDQTIGALVRLLRETANVPAGLGAALIEAKDARNFLAHGYFRDRAEDFVSRVGRASMIAELERVQKLFVHADDELRAVVEPFAAQSGFTREILDRYQDEYLARTYATAAAIDAAMTGEDDQGQAT